MPLDNDHKYVTIVAIDILPFKIGRIKIYYYQINTVHKHMHYRQGNVEVVYKLPRIWNKYLHTCMHVSLT